MFDAGLVVLPITTLVLVAEWGVHAPGNLVSDDSMGLTVHILSSIMAFGVLFFVTIGVCTLWLAALDVELGTAFAAALTCVANVGPGFAEVGPTLNFANIPASGKLVLSLGMILGRLEFFTVLALILPSTWRR